MPVECLFHELAVLDVEPWETLYAIVTTTYLYVHCGSRLTAAQNRRNYSGR